MSTRPTPEPGGSPSDPRKGTAPGAEAPGTAPAGGPKREDQRPGPAADPREQTAGGAAGAAGQTRQGEDAGRKRRSRPAAAGTASAKAKKERAKEDGTPHDWTLFRVVIALYGVLIIAYGIWQIAAGTASLPGVAESGGPTVASSYAGLAAVLCGVGASLIAIAVKFKWANMLSFVCFAIFLGGVGRILAWAFFGLPHWSMILLMVLDLVVPPCLLVWYGWIRKANAIRREMASEDPRGGARGRR
ncbi:DUF4345 domain-containing protein [Rothia halotolerans]|uniref:DUF4345 domain-containing protein n=1 Tax=Rothia halotolerans TaxID=405770 RepID=UPI00101CF8E0|nr:DUF4345 domain-containing protein [Rothia halotolerans]